MPKLISKLITSLLLLILCCAAHAPAQADDPQPAKAPPEISTAQSEVGKLLRQWFAEGSAAGNVGDFYDNRDRTHSELDRSTMPQLAKIEYSKDELERRADWAASRITRPAITFGNSSTSAGVHQGGSNVRHYYTSRRGMETLYEQYANNNLYIYPEHLDHDPGHNGQPGYGDLYPANTAYLITSQGSSGSDQPFMRAIPLALAALRPDVKTKLRESNLVSPTLQMLLRMTNKNIESPDDYLTGKAHPTVFEGSLVQELKMVQAAHEITVDKIPPLVKLEVVEEDAAVEGVDFFDPDRSEKHFDTPGAIARIVRAGKHVHRIVVSAAGSLDVNKRPLAYHWRVLRGDAERIRIRPLNESGSLVEIQVPYHARRNIDADPKLQSNRVDIGAFVHNGAYYSAPAFVTFFSLDNEARTYDDVGRLLEIGYGVGETTLAVAKWGELFDLVQKLPNSPPAKFLSKKLSVEQMALVERTGEAYRAAFPAQEAAAAPSKLANEAKQLAQGVAAKAEEKKVAVQKALDAEKNDETTAALAEATKAATDAQAQVKARETEEQAARTALETATRATTDALAPAKTMFDQTFAGWLADPSFAHDNAEAIAAAFAASEVGRAGFVSARDRLARFGFLKADDGAKFTLTPLREGDTPLAGRLTTFERSLLAQLNSAIVSQLLLRDLVQSSFQTNFVDAAISASKDWRDVMHYDPAGNVSGWTRYHSGGKEEFNAAGQLVMEKDDQGRCITARTVRYQQEGGEGNRGGRFRDRNWSPLREVPGSQLVRFKYADANDRRGTETRETIAEGK